MQRTRTTYPEDAPKIKVTYDVLDEPLSLPKHLMDTFLKYPKYSDLIALFSFYYYTAKWQHTNQPKATTAYTATGMNWGTDKVIKIKGLLKQLGVIEDIVQRDASGRVIGHYIKLSFTTLGVLPGLVKSEINTLNPNKRKILSEKNIIPPSLQLVTAYCTQRNNGINAQEFIDFYTSKGWMVGSNKMVDWHAAVSTWERKATTTQNKFKKPFIISDGIKYRLKPDGTYRNIDGYIYNE